MSQVPNAANAIIADDKITNYLLNAAHARGAGKAKFFQAFGFSAGKWTELKTALLAHPLANPVINQTSSPVRDKYVVSCSLQSPDGRNPCIISVWAIEPPDTEPRLLTAFANPQGAPAP